MTEAEYWKECFSRAMMFVSNIQTNFNDQYRLMVADLLDADKRYLESQQKMEEKKVEQTVHKQGGKGEKD